LGGVLNKDAVLPPFPEPFLLNAAKQ